MLHVHSCIAIYAIVGPIWMEQYSYLAIIKIAHKVLLVCSTQNIARVQYTKVDSHAVHKKVDSCADQFMSHACTD